MATKERPVDGGRSFSRSSKGISSLNAGS